MDSDTLDKRIRAFITLYGGDELITLMDKYESKEDLRIFALIVETVCSYFQIQKEHIFTQNRITQYDYNDPLKLITYFTNYYTRNIKPNIIAELTKVRRRTVYNRIQLAEQLISNNKKFKDDYDKINSIIEQKIKELIKN